MFHAKKYTPVSIQVSVAIKNEILLAKHEPREAETRINLFALFRRNLFGSRAQ
jgi:hypothetical protein